MPRGGKRQGAGRKSGSATKRSRKIADEAIADGLTPLDVMLKAMRGHAEAKRWDDAAKVAKDAAPYLHPRLTSIAGDPDKPQVHRLLIGWESNSGE